MTEVFNYLLKRMISCLSTVFIDSSYRTGYFISTICMSKSAGSLDKMSSASPSTTSYKSKKEKQHKVWYNVKQGCLKCSPGIICGRLFDFVWPVTAIAHDCIVLALGLKFLTFMRVDVFVIFEIYHKIQEEIFLKCAIITIWIVLSLFNHSSFCIFMQNGLSTILFY